MGGGRERGEGGRGGRQGKQLRICVSSCTIMRTSWLSSHFFKVWD